MTNRRDEIKVGIQRLSSDTKEEEIVVAGTKSDRGLPIEIISDKGEEIGDIGELVGNFSLAEALRVIDEINDEEPIKIITDGVQKPREKAKLEGVLSTIENSITFLIVGGSDLGIEPNKHYKAIPV